MGAVPDGIWFVWEFIIWPLVMLSWAIHVEQRRREKCACSEEVVNSHDKALR
ncbi:hypothetical protein MycrhDRAFT_5762 [Mycolicibacterium rhodesiae JS60]|nr:hypothetical protein MycrhDRAFT_5762 [Mycolicibacterium rhodesiae JS60]